MKNPSEEEADDRSYYGREGGNRHSHTLLRVAENTTILYGAFGKTENTLQTPGPSNTTFRSFPQRHLHVEMIMNSSYSLQHCL